MDSIAAFKEGSCPWPDTARHTRCIIDAVPNPCLIVDQNCRVQVTNQVFFDMFGQAVDRMISCPFDELGVWKPTGLHELLRAAGNSVSVAFDLEMIVDLPPQFAGYIIATARRIEAGAAENEYAMITLRHHEVEALQRAAHEMARVHSREHRIATQLQQALCPPIPAVVPGLSLKEYYRACMGEANVGGDFLDVYELRENVYAIVLGDVSGKGLAAATQVSAVRNMLRYALFRGRTLHGSVEQLNAMLTEQGLLTGFASIFVALYNVRQRTLTYVSCGHEPGLLRRAEDGSILEMPAQGTPLGVNETARYQEEVIPLAPGDSFLLFTDGLSEAGQNRRQMLGTEGMIDIFCTAPQTYNVALLVDHVVAKAEAYAESEFRDDVCLLAGIVT